MVVVVVVVVLTNIAIGVMCGRPTLGVPNFIPLDRDVKLGLIDLFIKPRLISTARAEYS